MSLLSRRVQLAFGSAGLILLAVGAIHANCYITKPVDLAEFLKVVKSIDSFWLSVVQLPREVGA